MRYDPKRNLSRLDVTVISQSSADQRKGRAGRTASGTCYRLYSEASYNNMEKISLPEILKTHLGHALLKLAELGITPDMYDFVQSPSQDAIVDALKTLHRLGALKDDVITDTGKWIARLPFNPKMGLMTLKGHECGILYDTLVLVALVSAGSGLFYRGASETDRTKLDKVKVKFSHAGGDFITGLQVYQAWVSVAERQKNQWCMENSVNAKAIRAVKDIVKEVCRTLKNEAKVSCLF
jgi:HrpA-like RNA helicase